MHRFFKKFSIGALLLFPLLAFSKAFAQTSPESLFTRPDNQDMALSWLEALFREGTPYSDFTSPTFEGVTSSLRHILGLYSSAMLALAGLLLLYYAVMFIAQTAHTGEISWKEKNRMWAPLRFALVLGLLVPIGGGLNLGQYAILKLTEQGSALASNAWEVATLRLKEPFTQLVTPRAPDLRHLTTRAVEISLCQSIYNHLYKASLPNKTVAMLGEIKGSTKIPATRLTPETWQFANNLHKTPPLCGAYHFLTPSADMQASTKGESNDVLLKIDESLAVLGDSARAAAERLSLQTSVFAEGIADDFLKKGSETPLGTGPVFEGLLKDQEGLLQTRIETLAKEKNKIEANFFADLQEKGWLSAGTLLVDIMTRQSILGNYATRSVPQISPPILGHDILTFKNVLADVTSSADLHYTLEKDRGSIYILYQAAQKGMKKARAWIYQSKLPSPELVLSSSLDVEDHLHATTDAQDSFTLLRRALDAGFASFGVWGRSFSDTKHEKDQTLTREMMVHPLAALSEIGRRYNDFGTWMMGLSGLAFERPSTLIAGGLYTLIGGLIALAGLGLLYLVPFLPLFRFFVAAFHWLLSVFEAIASLPLVAIAHMSPSGEGLASPAARRAYGLWLSVFLRPFLILFGFLVGWAGLFIGSIFLNKIFASLMQSLAIIQIDSLTSLRVIFTLAYAVLILVLVNVAFKGITAFPNRSIEWLSSMLTGEGGQAALSVYQAPSSMSLPPSSISSSGAAHPATSSHSAGPLSSLHEAVRGQKTTAAPSSSGKTKSTRDSQLFPQYKDKDLPTYVEVRTNEGNIAVAAKDEKGSAAAAASTGKEGATAIASAKASVTIKTGEDKQHALTDMAREIEDGVRKISEESFSEESEDGDGKVNAPSEKEKPPQTKPSDKNTPKTPPDKDEKS